MKENTDVTFAEIKKDLEYIKRNLDQINQRLTGFSQDLGGKLEISTFDKFVDLVSKNYATKDDAVRLNDEILSNRKDIESIQAIVKWVALLVFGTVIVAVLRLVVI